MGQKRAAMVGLAKEHQQAVLRLAMKHHRTVLPLLRRASETLTRLLETWTEHDAEGVRRWKPQSYRDALGFIEMFSRSLEKRMQSELDAAIAEARRMAAADVEADFATLSELFGGQ